VICYWLIGSFLPVLLHFLSDQLLDDRSLDWSVWLKHIYHSTTPDVNYEKLITVHLNHPSYQNLTFFCKNCPACFFVISSYTLFYKFRQENTILLECVWFKFPFFFPSFPDDAASHREERKRGKCPQSKLCTFQTKKVCSCHSFSGSLSY